MANSNEKLDAVLRCLNDVYDKAHTITTIQHNDGSTEHSIGLPANDTMTKIALNAHLIFIEQMDTIELDLIMTYLAKETPYVELLFDPIKFKVDEYRIKYAGKVFIENGGYTKVYEREIGQKRTQNLKDYLLILGALVASVAGSGLLYFEYVKLNHHNPYSLTFWQIGAMVSIPSLLICIVILLPIRKNR